MKKISFLLLLLLPFVAFSQYDFDSRYFTINAKSLPDVPSANATTFSLEVEKEATGNFTLDNTPTFAETLRSFKISSSNYWQPVDMMGAVTTTKNYVDKTIEISPTNTNRFGYSGYGADESSKVKNKVYVEVRGLDLLDPCPPYGICPRCAPYRYNRGY